MSNLLYSPYAPVRYRDEVWWRYSMNLVRRGQVTSEGKIGYRLYETMDEELVVPYAEAFIEAAKGDEEAEASLAVALAHIQEMRFWMPLTAQFEACGRQIFDFEENLVELLRHTDVGECTLEGWNPPHNAFFLRFGKQENIRLDYVDENTQFEYLDGAFVAVSPVEIPFPGRRIRFGMTTVREDNCGMTMPGYFLDFYPDTHNLPIDEAIEAALAYRVKEMECEPDASESWKAISAARQDRFRDSAELLRQASRLIFNALFYVESAGAARPIAPGRDVPPDLAVKWQNGNPRQREKMRSRLTADGYTVVNLLGQEIQGSAVATRDGGPIRTHWRRGHWRQQPYGEGMALRRRTWIKPVMVNQDLDSGDLPGRIYATGAEGINKVH